MIVFKTAPRWTFPFLVKRLDTVTNKIYIIMDKKNMYFILELFNNDCFLKYFLLENILKNYF